MVSILFGMFFISVVVVLAKFFSTALSGDFGGSENSTLRNLGLILAAAFGAPFIAWRSIVAQKQADTAEQGLITDRINKAVAALGADKEVNLKGGKRTKPNFEVRIGAIFALERIAQDSPRDHVRIMQILCAYVRENAPVSKAAKFPESEWKPLPNPYSSEENAGHVLLRERRFGERNRAGIHSFAKSQAWLWARSLKSMTDIQTIIDVVGARSTEQLELETRHAKLGVGAAVFDLSSCNFQGLDFRRAKFPNMNFSNSSFDGATISGATFSRSNFENCGLVGVEAMNAEFANARFMYANLEGSEFHHASFQGAIFEQTGAHGANFTSANLKLKICRNSSFECANLASATFGPKAFISLMGRLLGHFKPERAPKFLAGKSTSFCGSNLFGTIFEGVTMCDLHFDADTYFWPRGTQNSKNHVVQAENMQPWLGANFRDIDLSEVYFPDQFLSGTCGNELTILPRGVARPSNWDAMTKDAKGKLTRLNRLRYRDEPD